jgi:hypothetical protein
MDNSFEVYYNVWDCKAVLKVSLWRNNTLIDSVTIPSTKTEIAQNVKMINRSGKYPAKKLNLKTMGLINKAIEDLNTKHKT